jgi:hypothetical protein
MRKMITTKWLRDNSACEDGIKIFASVFGDNAELKTIINYAIEQKSGKLLDYANWLVVRCMNRTSQIKYAIYVAEQVLHIFEEKYPDDARPRKAIQAAKKYLKKRTKNNDIADAANAAYASANAAAYSATYAIAAADAAYATYAVAYATYVADIAADANAASANAAYAAYASANAAYAAANVAGMKISILNKGIELIYGGRK